MICKGDNLTAITDEAEIKGKASWMFQPYKEVPYNRLSHNNTVADNTLDDWLQEAKGDRLLQR